ncbi:LysR family transcriptional regulator [Rhizobium alvei]|uniref:LysR family transcriptional regulator n=1 Tax=Rhizobium alvei TaxID=1132659 RepID=A0ABT8YQY4_9HYPH|nr:LysR family transcriptional regulator [Rhizobium alvei]MDO6966151.1 LysR family transcriptional regulator [Rhizobium alvei]
MKIDDGKNLSLDQLLLFQAILKERSVTGAAEALGLNQPTVSQSLRRLRGILGDELFIRSGRGVEPTSRALELVEPVERILTILAREVLARSDFSPRDSDRHFVINTTDLGEITFVPSILRRFRAESQRITLEAKCLKPQDLMNAMRLGDVDLALGYFPELTAHSVYSQSLADHPFVCLARKGHPLIRDGLSVEEFRCAEHVGLIGEGHAQRRMEDRINSAGIDRKVAFRSQNYASIPFIVRDSDLIATVPKMLAFCFAEFLEIEVFKPPIPIEPIHLKQYWTERQHKDPGQIWLRRIVAEIFLNNDPAANFKVGNGSDEKP